MWIVVTDRSDAFDAEAKQNAERRLRFALSRFDGRITKVECVIGGPLDRREQPERSMRLSLRLRGAEDVVIADRDTHLERCLARLAERAARDVRRSIDRAKFFVPSQTTAKVQRGAS